jgi:hypothetical protein
MLDPGLENANPQQFKLEQAWLAFLCLGEKVEKIDATCAVCLTIAMMVMLSILCQTTIALSIENPPSYVLPLIASMTLMAMEAINKLFSHGGSLQSLYSYALTFFSFGFIITVF